MSKGMDINKELEETLTKALHEERMKAYQPVHDLFNKYNISPDDRMKLVLDSQSQAEKEVDGVPELDRVIEITIENINILNQNKER
jgi:sulfur relay (sulfurtransferase) DsrC/TusE family protein